MTDYTPYTISAADAAAVPGLAPAAPYAVDIKEFGLLIKGGIPALCGKPDTPAVGAGAKLSGAKDVTVVNIVGGLEDAPALLSTASRAAKACKAPFASGSSQLVPADKQPKVKKVGDGAVAFSTSIQGSTTKVHQLYVRRGKYFVSYFAVLANPDVTTITTADLNRLAKGAAAQLAKLDKATR